MHYLFFILTCLALSFSSVAQSYSTFHLGFNGGISFVNFAGKDVVGLKTGAGWTLEFKMGWSKKHVELWGGMDFFGMGGRARLEAKKNSLAPVSTVDLSGPASRMVPYIMLNYKINFAGRSHLYAGGYAGGATGTWRGDQLLAGMTGLQLGYVHRLGKRLDLEISENWRHMKLTDVYYENSSVQLVVYYAPVTINYFTTNIGIRLRFAKDRAKD